MPRPPELSPPCEPLSLLLSELSYSELLPLSVVVFDVAAVVVVVVAVV